MKHNFQKKVEFENGKFYDIKNGNGNNIRKHKVVKSQSQS